MATTTFSNEDFDLMRFEKEVTTLSEIPNEEFNSWLEHWQPSYHREEDLIPRVPIIHPSSASSTATAHDPSATQPTSPLMDYFPPSSAPQPIAATSSAAASPATTPESDVEPEFVETNKGNFTVGKFYLNTINRPEDSSPPQLKDLGPEFAGFQRRRSLSKIPLSELYEVMGLAHDPNCALQREETIMRMLAAEGFELGEQTWIRDTNLTARQMILERIFVQTFKSYGYSRSLLEAIIRRGTYARMQSNLRRQRRRRVRLGEKR